MTNKIKYNQYPDKEEFSKLYETLSQQELGNYYGCNKLRVRKWIDHFGLLRRTQGGGNNRKYDLKEENLREMVNNGYSNQDIIQVLQINNISSLNQWFKKFNIKRNYNTNEYKKYCRKVRYLTETEYSKYSNEINPKKFPRTLCGVDGGYQLDHIKGVSECFCSGVSIEDCASKNNLQMLPWKNNLSKRIFHKNNKDKK